MFNEVREARCAAGESVESDQMIPAGLATAVDKSLLARIGDAFLALPNWLHRAPASQPVLEKRRRWPMRQRSELGATACCAAITVGKKGKLVRPSSRPAAAAPSPSGIRFIDRHTGGVHTTAAAGDQLRQHSPTSGKFLVYDSPLSGTPPSASSTACGQSGRRGALGGLDFVSSKRSRSSTVQLCR